MELGPSECSASLSLSVDFSSKDQILIGCDKSYDIYVEFYGIIVSSQQG